MRRFCAAVHDDEAMCEVASPVLAAGLFALDRSRRQAALSRVPEELRPLVRHEFEVARSKAPPSTATSEVALAVLDAACRRAKSLRALVPASLAAAFGVSWSEELGVLAHGDRTGWRPLAVDVGPLMSWWVGVWL